MSGLRYLLEETADEAKVYDVTQPALIGGRRRRRARAVAGSTAIALAAGIVAIGITLKPAAAPTADQTPRSAAVTGSNAPQVPPPKECEVAKLALPAGYPMKSVVAAGDPTGRFLAGRAYPRDGRDRLLLWDNGQVRALPGHGSDAEFRAVNSSGHAIEISLVGEDTQSWVYHDGGFTKLKGVRAAATAINSKGVVVGLLHPDSPGRGVPVVWRSYSAEPERLELPGDDWLIGVHAVDDAGNIIGSGSAPRSTVSPLIWSPDGKVRRPAIPDYPPNAEEVHPISLHSGQVTLSVSVDGRKSFHYWRIDLATGSSTKLDLPAWVEHLAMNGWALRTISGTLVSGDIVLKLPDLPNRPSKSPASLPPRPTRPPSALPSWYDPNEQRASAIFTTMSLDGRVIGGYQSVSDPARPDQETEIVATVWRCH